MANTDQQYRVHGECIIQAGVGTANALVTLGVMESGARITIQKMYKEIMTDVGGDMVPADFQKKGEIAIIECSPVAWIETNLRLMRTRDFLADGTTRNTDGLAAGRGQFVGQHGLAFSVAIASGNYGEDPWYFPTCFIPSDVFNLGTDYMKHGLVLRAWPYIPGSVTTAIGRVCWQRTIP